MVKECQVEHFEWLEGVISLTANDNDLVEEVEAFEVGGEVSCRAFIPGDSPKVQVKLELPEDYMEFSVHPMSLKPQRKRAMLMLGEKLSEEGE